LETARLHGVGWSSANASERHVKSTHSPNRCGHGLQHRRGGIVLSRAVGEPRLLSEQIILLQSYIKLFFNYLSSVRP
ncbi:hypothetical protein NLU14_21060, partial [Marinobacter sp. 71-i]